MTPQIWTWVIAVGVIVVATLIYVIITTIAHKMLAHRLGLLAEDIDAFGRSSLITELQRCEFCRNTSHVHLWSYGNGNATKNVLICYRCVYRIQKHLDPPGTRRGVSTYDLSTRPNERPFNRSRSRQPLARR